MNTINEKIFLCLDTKNHNLLINNQEIYLTKQEMLLVALLMERQGYCVKSEEIEYHIWEHDSMDCDCLHRLKTLIYALRKKIGKQHIKNCHGFGYKIIL